MGAKRSEALESAAMMGALAAAAFALITVWTNGPVSYYCVGAFAAALILVGAAGDAHPYTLGGRFWRALTMAAAWTAVWIGVGFFALWVAQVTLGLLRVAVDPALVLGLEARLGDVLVGLQDLGSWRVFAMAAGVMLALAFVVRAWRAVRVLGWMREAIGALVAILTVVTGFSFVTAERSIVQYEREIGPIRARLVDRLTHVASLRREQAAIMWAAAELRRLQETPHFVEDLRAALGGAAAHCARQRALFDEGYRRYEGAAPSAEDLDGVCDAGQMIDLIAAQIADADLSGASLAEAARRWSGGGAIAATAEPSYAEPPTQTETPVEISIDAALQLARDDRAWVSDIVAPETLDRRPPRREIEAMIVTAEARAEDAEAGREALRRFLTDGIAALVGDQLAGPAARVAEVVIKAALDAASGRLDGEARTAWARATMAEAAPATAVEEAGELPREALAFTALRAGAGLGVEASSEAVAAASVTTAWEAAKPEARGNAGYAIAAGLAAATLASRQAAERRSYSGASPYQSGVDQYRPAPHYEPYRPAPRPVTPRR